MKRFVSLMLVLVKIQKRLITLGYLAVKRVKYSDGFACEAPNSNLEYLNWTIE